MSSNLLLALTLSSALVATALEPHTAFFQPTKSGLHDSPKPTSMMRRENPKQAEKSSDVMEQISVNGPAKQIIEDHMDQSPFNKVTDIPPASVAEKSTKIQQKAKAVVAEQKESNNLVRKAPKSAALMQESSASTVQRGIDEKNRHPARLSDEDEALYRKLFPEDREQEIKEAVSALELSGKKAFRIKVPTNGGKRLCLTEENHGYNVRAEPCRRNSSRQKWYWMGAKLKNLYSKGRCLGLERRKHHIGFQTESLLEQEKGKHEAEAEGHHLSMSFQCGNSKAPLAWQIDELGRLKSNWNDQCMAIKETDNFNALVLPCEKA